MTVRGDIDRAIAMAEAARGNYLLFATESEDTTAQRVFQDMAGDMERHVKILESRRDYLDQYNQLNAQLAGGNNQGQGGQNTGQKQNAQNQQKNQGGYGGSQSS